MDGWTGVIERVFTQKRRATQAELARVCAEMCLDIDKVAEAWIDDRGCLEIVMRGFIDKVQVNVTCGEMK